MEESFYLPKVIEIFQATIPGVVTYEIFISETVDLTVELDEFDGLVKELLGVDELKPETITEARRVISELVLIAEKENTIEKRLILIELLKSLDEKLHELFLLS